MERIFFKIFIFLIIILIIPCCLTLKSKYKSEMVYKIFNTSKKPESVFKIKIDEEGNKIGELTSQLISPAVIIGDVIEDQSGDINFMINSIKFISNWANGWTQGESIASGNFIFYKENNELKVEIKEEFEIWDVIKGEIRYDIEYYRGEDGLEKVKNRMTRISAVIAFLKRQEFIHLPEFFGHATKKSVYGDSFKKITQPFLFPETIDIDKLKRKKQFPVEYDIPVGLKGDIVFKEGFFWRKSYTEKFFPEKLWQSRNSASIWRDYEEAIHLFYMLYNMDYYFNNVIKDASFTRIKLN